MGILLVGILLGVVVIPIVQGRGAGLDAYTAICRALGILPGSPAQPQPSDRTPPTPVSQVIWTPEVLQILARADVAKGRAKVQEVCVACHGETGVSPSPEFPHLAGQSGAAIYKQLYDYRTGSRVHPLDDGYCQGAGRIEHCRRGCLLRRPAAAQSQSRDAGGIPAWDRADSWSLAIRAATFRLARHAIVQAPGARSKRRCSPSTGRIHRPAAEAVCIGRATQ